MNMPDRETLYTLLALSQKKLALLEALAQSLGELCEEISEGETDLLAQHDEDQNNYMKRIGRIDLEFRALVGSLEGGAAIIFASLQPETTDIPLELQKIGAILSKQRESLHKITNLNDDAIARAQAMAISIKDRIIDINKQKKIITKYHPVGANKTGSLLDYKEKSRK